jgi:tRNA modification GTPase
LDAFVARCIGAQQSIPPGLLDFGLASEELRTALHALAALVGTVDVEEVLDVVFQDFCIGK